MRPGVFNSFALIYFLQRFLFLPFQIQPTACASFLLESVLRGGGGGGGGEGGGGERRRKGEETFTQSDSEAGCKRNASVLSSDNRR